MNKNKLFLMEYAKPKFNYPAQQAETKEDGIHLNKKSIELLNQKFDLFISKMDQNFAEVKKNQETIMLNLAEMNFRDNNFMDPKSTEKRKRTVIVDRKPKKLGENRLNLVEQKIEEISEIATNETIVISKHLNYIKSERKRIEQIAKEKEKLKRKKIQKKILELQNTLNELKQEARNLTGENIEKTYKEIQNLFMEKVKNPISNPSKLQSIIAPNPLQGLQDDSIEDNINQKIFLTNNSFEVKIEEQSNLNLKNVFGMDKDYYTLGAINNDKSHLILIKNLRGWLLADKNNIIESKELKNSSKIFKNNKFFSYY